MGHPLIGPRRNENRITSTQHHRTQEDGQREGGREGGKRGWGRGRDRGRDRGREEQRQEAEAGAGAEAGTKGGREGGTEVRSWIRGRGRGRSRGKRREEERPGQKQGQREGGTEAGTEGRIEAGGRGREGRNRGRRLKLRQERSELCFVSAHFSKLAPLVQTPASGTTFTAGGGDRGRKGEEVGCEGGGVSSFSLPSLPLSPAGVSLQDTHALLLCLYYCRPNNRANNG